MNNISDCHVRLTLAKTQRELELEAEVAKLRKSVNTGTTLRERLLAKKQRDSLSLLCFLKQRTLEQSQLMLQEQPQNVQRYHPSQGSHKVKKQGSKPKKKEKEETKKEETKKKEKKQKSKKKKKQKKKQKQKTETETETETDESEFVDLTEASQEGDVRVESCPPLTKKIF